MKVFALVPVWLAVMAVTCAGNELPYTPVTDAPGIVQFSYSFSPLPPAAATLSESLRLFRWTLRVRQPLRPQLSGLFLLRVVIRLLPYRARLLQCRRVPALQPALFSVQLK